MKVGEEDLPTLRIVVPASNNLKVASPTHPNDMTIENVGVFIEETLAGKINRRDSSTADHDGAVRILTLVDYDTVAWDTSKHVMVMFYAPWCGFCKQLAPTWEELAEHYYEDDDYVIAKYDAERSNPPRVEVEGYPTVVFFPKNNKDGIKYEGTREFEDLQ